MAADATPNRVAAGPGRASAAQAMMDQILRSSPDSAKARFSSIMTKRNSQQAQRVECRCAGSPANFAPGAWLPR